MDKIVPTKMEVLVEYDYAAEEPDELSIKKGDIVKEVSQFEEGWFIGNLDGKIGVFPDNFVKIIPSSAGKERDTPDSERNRIQDSEEATKPQRVTGIGLGNIFSGQPIQLKQTAIKDVMKDTESNSDKTLNSAKAIGDSTPSPVLTDRVRAKFVYDPKQSDELELQVDDVIQVLDRKLSDEGWWKGKNLRTRKIGVFPDNFVVPMSEVNKENTEEMQVKTPPLKSAPVSKPVVVTTIGIQNGTQAYPLQSNRASSTDTLRLVSSVKTTGSHLSGNEPPAITAKPSSVSVSQTNISSMKSVTVGVNNAMHRDTPKVAVTNAPGRNVNGPAAPSGYGGGLADKNTLLTSSGRGSKWKASQDRTDLNDRPKSRTDESHVPNDCRQGHDFSDENTPRLTGLTTERPRQTNRRLPSKFARSSTPTSEMSTDGQNESESLIKESHSQRAQNGHLSKHTPTPYEDARIVNDASEHRTNDSSNRTPRGSFVGLTKTGSLQRSEGVSGSADLIRSPEAGGARSVATDVSKQAITTLQTQLDQLKLQHSHHLSESKQLINEMRHQIEQLKNSNTQLRSELMHGQCQMTERLQTLMNELDETKKQRAADVVELSRLRSLLMQLDAKAMLKPTAKVESVSPTPILHNKRIHLTGDRLDVPSDPVEDFDSQSVYDEEEDCPDQFKVMIGETRGGPAMSRNGDNPTITVHPSSLNKANFSRVAPPLRPRPTHPSNYTKT